MIFDQNTLLAYVRDDLEIKDVGLNTPLFSSGLLDSVSMVGLLGFIEQASGNRSLAAGGRRRVRHTLLRL